MKNLLLIFIGVISFCDHSYANTKNNHYKHILITNDDGIGDIERLKGLADAVKGSADRVSIFVSDADRSGSSNHTVLGKHLKTLSVTIVSVDTINHISVYTTPGNPADCVLLGLSGFFGDDRPDLVLSGINGGANSGPEWFGSGTIGAARMAGFLGVKAVALSGCDEKNPNFPAVTKWIDRFINSPSVKLIEKNQYITIGFPEKGSIKGIKAAERRVSCEFPENIITKKVSPALDKSEANTSNWTMDFKADPRDMNRSFDDTYIRDGYIVVTVMSIDENNKPATKKIVRSLPAFDTDPG